MSNARPPKASSIGCRRRLFSASGAAILTCDRTGIRDGRAASACGKERAAFCFLSVLAPRGGSGENPNPWLWTPSCSCSRRSMRVFQASAATRRRASASRSIRRSTSTSASNSPRQGAQAARCASTWALIAGSGAGNCLLVSAQVIKRCRPTGRLPRELRGPASAVAPRQIALKDAAQELSAMV